MVVSVRPAVGFLRVSVLGAAFAAIATAGPLTACGDDTVVALPDAAVRDATTVDVSIDTYDGGCTAFDASNLDDAQIVEGHLLVVALKCQKCHGDQLAGNPDGVVSPQTEGGLAYPPNLTPDPTTGLGCWSNADIANAFLNGIDDEGMPLCPPMPHFAEAGIDASGAADIVAYLRSVHPAVMNIPNTPSCTFGPVAEAGPEAGAPDAGPDAAPDAPVEAAAEGGPDASGDGAGQDGGGDGASQDGPDAGDAAGD